MSVQLTEAQERAIKAPIDQPSLILAAAGSGKTLVLCHRILHLIFQGVAAKHILAVTFSRRAGQDLLHRLHSVATSLAAVDSHVLLEGIHVRTFHSFCLTVLRAFPSQAGLSPDFVVLTPKMQLQILEDLIRSWYDEKHAQTEGRNPRANHSLDFRDITEPYGRNNFRTEALRLHQQLRRFGNSKKSECSLNNRKVNLDKHNNLSEWVYDRYRTAVKSINGIDFIDFPRLAGKVLENCQTALATMGLQAHYVLVDEFQDTDVDQFQLLRLLCRDHNRLTIVGDDDQQIYTWRGAAGFDNLATFDRVFHGATVTKLEQNFRSTGAIVAAARSVIAKNVHRTPKTIRTASPTGTILSVCECRNEQCEAAAVAKFILSLKEQSIPLREIAVLYRVQHVGLEIQEMLRARGIPCNSRGHGSGAGEGYSGAFQYHDAVGSVLHDILAILRLVLSEEDDLSCKQVMEALCPDFDLSRVSKCVQHLQLQQGISLYKALISTRSHLLGLKKHEDLTFTGIGLHQADEHIVEGLHSLMRILETAKEDIKELRMKDVIMNLLQQISPYRTRAIARIASKGEAISTKQSISQWCQDGNIEFAGIKALMGEASRFDTEWESEGQDNINKGVARSNGYRNLLQQKTSRQSLRESYKLLSQSSPCKTQNGHIKRLQSFIDHVTLKLHDGELGDCGACSMSSAIDNQNTGEAGSIDSVVLSTVHQAKGLEWTAVILVRANEGVLPLMDRETVEERVIPQAFDSGFHMDHQKSAAVADRNVFKADNSGEGDIMVLRDVCKLDAVEKGRNTAFEALEEERRLMYVALTRAKRFLLITHVMLHGQQSMSPSRFLADIPKGLMHRTTCYDSNIQESKSDTSKQVLDVKRSDPSDSYKASYGVSASCKVPLKSKASSQDIKKVRLQLRTNIKISKKRQLEACKSASKGAVNVEESLKDIDDLLDGMAESTNNRKARDHNVEVFKGQKRQSRTSCRIIESSSDDSDFETHATRNPKSQRHE